MSKQRGHKDLVRLSVSLDPQDHSHLCRMASNLNLSAAWLVRRAVSEFVLRYEDPAHSKFPLGPVPDKSSN